MSTNILYVRVIENEDAHFETDDYDQLFDDVEDQVPEDNFFLDLSDRRGRPHEVIDRKIPIKKLNWSGEGSGSLFTDTLVKKLVPHIRGKLLAFADWEGGYPEFWLIACGQLRRMDLAEVLKEVSREQPSLASLISEIVAKKGR